MESSNLSIIIVTYNNQETIKSCLDSVFLYEKHADIIVVDNNSSDDTLNCLKKYKDRIKILPQKKNLGFSKGNNSGFLESQGSFLAFLNPDTQLIEKDTLKKLVKLLEENLEYGLIAPKLIYPDMSEQNTVRSLPTVFNAFKEYILKIKGSYDFKNPNAVELTPVESVVGACMVLSRENFQRVKGFDERYPLYYEDLQLCKDLRELGLKIGYYPKIKVSHSLGHSGKKSPTNQLLCQSAKIYHGLIEYCLIQIIIRLGQLL